MAGMRLHLITLDLDGTLVDTAAEIAEAVNGALGQHGLQHRPAAEITALIGAGAHALVRRLLERQVPQPMDEAQRDAVVASFEACYASIAGTRCAPYPGCHAALTRIQDAGVHLACVTNKELRHAHAVLRHCGLDGFFQSVMGGDSLPHKKPHASVLRSVASHFGVALQSMAHVGDSAIDVAAARNAGVAAWAVPYGYNAGVPVALCGPDRMFDDLAAVADAVVALRT